MNAQENNLDCATLDPTTPDPPGVYSYSTDNEYFDSECEPIVLNIYFWGIMHPNGEDYYPEQANDALTGVANLNILYNQYNTSLNIKGLKKYQAPHFLMTPMAILYWKVFQTSMTFSVGQTQMDIKELIPLMCMFMDGQPVLAEYPPDIM